MELTDLSGTRAVIVGAGCPVGDAVAATLYGSGSDVILLGSGPKVWASAAAIQRDRSVGSVLCDHHDADAAAAGLREAHERLGGLDVLVLVSGEHEGGRQLSTVALDLVVGTIRAGAGLMQAGGRLVSIAPALDPLQGTDQLGGLIASMAARRVTATLALELAVSGLVFNTITPGYMAPTAPEAGPVGNVADGRVPASPPPSGRWCNPDDIANAALFLCTRWSDQLYGVDIPVDGGLHAVIGL